MDIVCLCICANHQLADSYYVYRNTTCSFRISSTEGDSVEREVFISKLTREENLARHSYGFDENPIKLYDIRIEKTANRFAQ